MYPNGNRLRLRRPGRRFFSGEAAGDEDILQDRSMAPGYNLWLHGITTVTHDSAFFLASFLSAGATHALIVAPIKTPRLNLAIDQDRD